MDVRKFADRLNEEKISREAAVALFNALGPKHVATARAWVRLADDLTDKDEYEEAAELYAKALPILEKHHHESLFNPEMLHILNKLASIILNNPNNEIRTTSFFLRYFEELDEWFGKLETGMDITDMFLPISDVDVGIEDNAYTMLLANQLLSKLIIMAIETFPIESLFYEQAVEDFIDHFDIFDMFSIETAFCINEDVIRYLRIKHRAEDAFLVTYKLVTSYLFFTPENGRELMSHLFELKDLVEDTDEYPMEEIEAMERSYRRHRKPWTLESLADFINKFLGSAD